MSLWKRFVRMIKSWFGGAISAMEDPRLILEQNIRELNDQIPKMNQNIATVKAQVTLLEKELKKYESEYKALEAKIKAAIKQGRDDIAQHYVMRYQQVKSSMETTREELALAQKAYEKALEVKKVFMKEREKKIKEAQEALRAHERSKWQKKIADTMQQFEVGGVAQTHDEMLRRLQEETAKNEAMLESALDSVDTESLKIEEEAEKIQAQDMLAQFKQEMGLIDVENKPTTETQNTQEQQKIKDDDQGI